MTARALTVEAVFVDAVELPAAERAAFLARRCAGDAALQARVERLLAAHERTLARGFLEAPTPSSRGPALRPAAKLGRYAILDEIGRGGMGVVYAAYDPVLHRKVALKQVFGGTAADIELEARALARLQHPNVVAVHDVGTDAGQLFIAMELVDGQPLSHWAASRGTLEILRALVAAGHGLADAHRAGILHRDFKPDNVLVDATGRARVADFGLAAEAALVEEDGIPMGTPGFMAPEIIAGRPATVQGDVYAYCRALAVLVVARADAPHWLEPLVARGLAEAPGARWPDLDELLGAIERELGADPADDPRPGRAQRRRVYALLAAIALAIPIVAVATGVSPGDRRAVFYLTLLPLFGFGLILAVFRRAMLATPFNRRGALSILAVTAAIAVHRGLTLGLDTSAAADACADLLIVASFLVGGSLDAPDRAALGAAGLGVAGAAAVAVFPAYGTWLFAAVMTAQLPFMYFHWVSKGARPPD